ncbi:MAG: VOC family protein [Chitinophagales bacterium]|nr:VOC family protein [Chitinophagales bacterium]
MAYHLVNWFEIPALDIERAKKFYTGIFSCGDFTDMQMGTHKMAIFPMPEDTENSGVTGAIIQGDEYQPNENGTTVYFGVDDCSEELSKVEDNGGKIVHEKKAIGEHGFVAHFIDTEGNRIALHSRK